MKEIANSSLMMILVVIGLVYIIGLSLAFLKKAYTRCLELGISKETINNVIKSSAVFSIVPAISIVVGFFALIAVFQSVVWPWWRLSVIGSLSYETQISGLLASSFGQTMDNLTPQQFGAVLILMSIGMLSGFIILIPFGKKMCMSVTKDENSSTWKYVFSGVFMMTLFAVYIPVILIGDTVQACVMITGLVVAIVLGILAKKPGLGWLNNFIMAFTLIAGMASSLLWVKIFG
ncbi:MAG: DUF5058 family protein [Lachnospiraceae bacterium]|nr:DUF5058 family protein [Lachnospiraceae bacterium]MBQ2405954.1 DUF5058 family protein [Lachnospiraceae bacterium]MEE0920517.1 DUF5058 family protein [Lachnospiraceae bacterium]